MRRTKPYAIVESRRLLSLIITHTDSGETCALVRSALCPCIVGELLRTANVLKLRVTHKYDLKKFQKNFHRNLFENFLTKNFCDTCAAISLQCEVTCRRDKSVRSLLWHVSTRNPTLNIHNAIYIIPLLLISSVFQ